MFLGNSLCKVTRVSILPAAKGGLDVSSARLLALPPFLASAVGAQATLRQKCGLENANGLYNDALEFWFYSAKCEEDPENVAQKNWTEPIVD